MKVSPTLVVRAIPVNEIDSMVDSSLNQLEQSVKQLLSAFVSNVNAESTFALELHLFEFLLKFAQILLEQLFNSLEPAAQELPPNVNHRDNNYRTLKTRSPVES
jgi:hypothetical protein